MAHLRSIKFFPLFIFLFELAVTHISCIQPKLDCHPLDGATKDKCEALGCTWMPVHGVINKNQPTSKIDEPWCSFPTDYQGYNLVSRSDNSAIIQRIRPSSLVEDIKTVAIDVTNHRVNGKPVLRVKIYDHLKDRHEPEIPIIKFDDLASKTSDQGLLDWSLSENLELEIRRQSTGGAIFRTDLRRLIFSDKFIQLNSVLGDHRVFGLGEHHDTYLKLADGYKTYSFFHTDRLPLPDGRRSYGSFPFFVSLDSNSSHAYGIYLLNSNAMDVALQPEPSITFRPIGGILDFFIFSGPKPLDVVSQFQHLVGLPTLPPRWSLGFHLCRYNYNSLTKTRQVWERNRKAGIPFDVMWNDIDNMDRHNDFSYDSIRYAGLPEFVNELHHLGMHYMLLFDPGLSQEKNYYPYELGTEMGIWIRNSTNQTLVGRVWNDSNRTVFPDFSNPKTIEFWSQLFEKFQSEIKFDGAWIDMNDISNFVDGSLDGCPVATEDIERPPYVPGGYPLQAHSLCLSAQHFKGREYDLHNLYSFYESIATYQALLRARPSKRPFIISRSSSSGQGHYSGHWSGDVLSNWDYLRWSIRSLLEHSMYGFSMMGSDICGFSGDTNPELCARWSTLGAFYTFSRNHNDDVSIEQDPVALGAEVVKANKYALTKRYKLLPYLYSLQFRANLFGEPVARSTGFEFFDHVETLNLMKEEDQFMLGNSILISPVVKPNTFNKTTLLPKGRWYEFSIDYMMPNFEIPKVHNSDQESVISDNVWVTDIPIFYRGGYILPVYRNVSATTIETVKQPFGLDVALSADNSAHGELYIDDGESVGAKFNHVEFRAEDGQLTVTINKSDFHPIIEIGLIRVMGIELPITQVSANGRLVKFSLKKNLLFIDLGRAEVSKTNKLVVQWK